MSPPRFTADPLTLRELILPVGQGFYVPMYQRDFTWGQEEIDRLFEDLAFGMTRACQGQNPSTFLGSVIVVEDRDGVSPRNQDAIPTQVLQVIDGQQRLTTLLLLFAVLSRSLAEGQVEINAAVAASGTPPNALTQWLLNTLTQQTESLLDAISINTHVGTAEYQYKPRMIRQQSDKWGNTMAASIYESDVAWFLMEAIRNRHANSATAQISPPASRPHLEQVVLQLEQCLDSICNGSTESDVLNDLSFMSDTTKTTALLGTAPSPVAAPAQLDPLHQAAIRMCAASNFLLSGVLVIEVRAPDEDYAFSLFEPLNTTGQLLTALETLKPLVVQAEGGTTSYALSPSGKDFALLETHFTPDFGNAEKTKRISEFLIAFALAESGERLARNLLDQRRYLRSEYRQLGSTQSALTAQREFVHHLSDSSSFFFDVWLDEDSAFMASADPFDRLAMEVLRTTNHTIVIPVLERYYSEWAASKTSANKKRFLEVLRAVTAFWTLWRTSRSTTKGIDDVYRRLMAVGAVGTAPLSPLARRPAVSVTSGPLPPPSAFKATLRDILATRGGVGTRATWVQRATTQPVYQTSKNLAKFVLLAAHEDFIDDTTQPGLIAVGAPGVFSCLSKEVWELHYSVEHIAPQSQSAADSTYGPAIYNQGLADRFGNLTLMPTELNQLVGSKSWPYKRGVYAVLGEASPQQRVKKLKALLPQLAPTTYVTVKSGLYLPFCRPIAKNSAQTLSASFVVKRGERVAEQAWDRLWPYLA